MRAFFRRTLEIIEEQKEAENEKRSEGHKLFDQTANGGQFSLVRTRTYPSNEMIILDPTR